MRFRGFFSSWVRAAIFSVCVICFSVRVLGVSAQSVGIAYCDVDRFYDTIPALFYNDSGFTPEGHLRWTSERYTNKVARVAALADSLALPLVALWGVETEGVVRDIAAACRNDYCYLHRTLNSLDGLDFALLYFADCFAPHYVEPGRRYLYVEGVLRRYSARPPHYRVRKDTVGLLLCSEERMAPWVARDLRQERPGAKLVILGRQPAQGLEIYGLRDAHVRAERAGRGNVRSRGGWRMRDRIAVDTALRIGSGEVYIRRFLLDASQTQPLATYDRRRYLGGTSHALPVYVYLE